MNSTVQYSDPNATAIAFFSSAAGLVLLNVLATLSAIALYVTRKCMKISYQNGQLNIPAVSDNPIGGISSPESPPSQNQPTIKS